MLRKFAILEPCILEATKPPKGAFANNPAMSGKLYKDNTYEKEIQNLFYKKGDKFILESELGFDKQIEGFLNNEAVEIKTILGSSSRTIRKRLKEAIAKNAKIVILYYPNNFSQKRLS